MLEGKLEFHPSDMGLTLIIDKGEVTVEFDQQRFRPADVPILLCNTAKIQKLGFQVKHSLKDIINDQLNYFLDPTR
jgi:GDPmannose 4,6-dehydratase